MVKKLSLVVALLALAALAAGCSNPSEPDPTPASSPPPAQPAPNPPPSQPGPKRTQLGARPQHFAGMVEGQAFALREGWSVPTGSHLQLEIQITGSAEGAVWGGLPCLYRPGLAPLGYPPTVEAETRGGVVTIDMVAGGPTDYMYVKLVRAGAPVSGQATLYLVEDR